MMAETSEEFENIFSFIDTEEKNKVPENISTKLNDVWITKLKEFRILRVENDKLKLNAEQEKFNYEREVLSIQGKLEEEIALKDEALSQKETFEGQVIKLEDELCEAKTKVITLTRDLQQSQNEQENVSSQSTAMAGNLETRNRQIQDLQEKVNKLEEQLSKALREKCDAIIKAEEAASKEIRAQYKEKRFDQEMALLSRQIDVLQHQLRERADENLDQKREHSSTILNLQATLNRSAEEIKVIKNENELYQKQCDEKSKRIEELLNKLNAASEAESKLDEMYRQELAAQKKLAEIYQGTAADEKERCLELEKGVEELRHLLQEANEQYGLLERTKDRLAESHGAEINKLQVLNKELKDELDKANVLFNATAKKDTSVLEDLSPSASAASNLAARGLSITQLYSEYMSVSEKMLATEAENRKLQRYVDQILLEIQDRVPLFTKQREEHKNALETINSLHSQLEDAVSRMEKQKFDLDEAVRHKNYLERENDRLNSQIKDLGRQVTILVTQVEAARAGLPPPPIPKDNSGSTLAGDVISDHMVVFRDVSELQEQNRVLRESLRKLSEDMETSDKELTNSKTMQIQEELKSVKAQLTEMHDLRKRQESLMDNIVKQRDMYKSFCNEQPSKNKTPTKQPTQMFGVSQAEVDNLRKELDEFKKKVTQLMKENDDYRKEVKTNEKMQQGEYDRIRTEMEKTMSENVKLVSQAEFNDERVKVLQHNSEVLQRQVAALQENNTTLHGIVGRHEATIDAQRREYMTVQKELSRSQVMVDNMNEEVKLLKEAETRLLAERETTFRSQSSQAMIIANLESIKNNLDRKDGEKTLRLENQVKDLTEKCSRFKTKLEMNADLKEAQSKLNVVEKQLQTIQLENKNLSKHLTDTKAELTTTKSRLKETQERTRVPITPPTLRVRSPVLSPNQSSQTQLRSSGPQVRDLQAQLSEEKGKVTNLQAELERSKKYVDELKSLSGEQEKQLKETSNSYKTTQEQFAKMEKEKDSLMETVTKLQNKFSTTTSDNENMKSHLQSMLNEAKDEIQASEKRLKDAHENFQKAKEEEEYAKKESKRLNELATEVQNKYETEVMLHGTDLKVLAELKKKQMDHDADIGKISEARVKAEEAVRDTRLGFEKRENTLRRENKDLLVRCNELEEQNKGLLDQFQQLSDKMSGIQTKLNSNEVGNESMNISFSDEEVRSSDQLREVIKYLRRERDVAAGKCEVAEAESQRLLAQNKNLDVQIVELKKTLDSEREKSQTSLDSASNYGELIRKVHTYDAIADSNRVLREEREALNNSLDEYKSKCNALEKQMEPLNDRYRANLNKIESLTLEKKNMENEKDMYKKRTQELVEKLNHAKPEDFMKLQQNFTEQQKSLQAKDQELSKTKNTLQQVQKNLQMTVSQKNHFNTQLQTSRDEARKLQEEAKKAMIEKNKAQQQIGEETKKFNIEKTRVQQQILQLQEKVRALEASAQQTETAHQQEVRKIREEINQDKQQVQENREQVLVSKGREDQMRHQLDTMKKEKDELESEIIEIKAQLEEITLKAENLEKQTIQLRKIANKYKKAVSDKGMIASPASADMEDGGSIGGAQTNSEKIRELEENIQSLSQKQSGMEEEAIKLHQENNNYKEKLSAKEKEIQNMKIENQQKESEVDKYRQELEAKARELQTTKVRSNQLQQKQVLDMTKKLEEVQNKKQLFENRASEVEKERDLLNKDVDMLNKKLQMQQRQIENLQKQAVGTSKPSTSGVTSEKNVFEPPPTANIKPMNAPVAPSASPRSQAATQVVPPSRPTSIPTASIKPMAPPSSGSTPTQGSTVVVVSPLETRDSDGMVSSTVTLPQATVTPTPAVSSPTLLTTTTTTPASTLTATVSPTPASASLTAPNISSSPLSSSTVAQSSPQPLTATQSTSISQSATSLESTAAPQSSSAAQPTTSPKTSVPPSSSVVGQSSGPSKVSTAQQPSTASMSVVTPLVSGTTSAGSAKPTATPFSRQESQDVSADALVSQAIALVTPLGSQEAAAGPSGLSSRKRKLDSSQEVSNEVKRSCVDEEELSSEETGPSSSHTGQEKGHEGSGHAAESDNVILIDSDSDEEDEDDDDEQEYRDQDDKDDDDDDDDDDDMEGRHRSSHGDDSDDDEMDHDDSSREASQGFEAGQAREAEDDLSNAEAEAEASSAPSSQARQESTENETRQNERPQPSAGLSQPSSSSQGNEAPTQTGTRPLAVPRPVVRQERLNRQNLTPFSQLPQYEEGGDDSIVPSTPTLFAPRRDGFSEAVSSPQVPSSGFVFGGSNPDIANPPQRSGLAQMAEGGLIDDTRIDLGQLDEGNRSHPTTPMHRSPSGAEGGVSTTEGGSGREPPAVLITGAEQSNDDASEGSRDIYNEADSMAAAEDDDDEEVVDDGEEEEDIHDDEMDDPDGEVEERGSSDDGSQPSQGILSSSPTSPSQRVIRPRGRLQRDPIVAARGGSRGLINRNPINSSAFAAASQRNRGTASTARSTGRARRSRPAQFGNRSANS